MSLHFVGPFFVSPWMFGALVGFLCLDRSLQVTIASPVYETGRHSSRSTKKTALSCQFGCSSPKAAKVRKPKAATVPNRSSCFFFAPTPLPPNKSLCSLQPSFRSARSFQNQQPAGRRSGSSTSSPSRRSERPEDSTLLRISRGWLGDRSGGTGD